MQLGAGRVSMVTHWNPREPHKIWVLNGRFWLRTTKDIYIARVSDSRSLRRIWLLLERNNYWFDDSFKTALLLCSTPLPCRRMELYWNPVHVRLFGRNGLMGNFVAALKPLALKNIFSKFKNLFAKRCLIFLMFVTDSQELYYQRVLWIWYMYLKALLTPF